MYTKFLSGVMKMFWDLDSGICKYTENHLIIYYKRIHFIVCELYLNKVVCRLLQPTGRPCSGPQPPCHQSLPKPTISS